MTPGDRVIVTEPACVEEATDPFGCGENAYRIYPGGWFPKDYLTPVEPEKIELWGLYDIDGRLRKVALNESLARLDEGTHWRAKRLIAYVVKDEPTGATP